MTYDGQRATGKDCVFCGKEILEGEAKWDTAHDECRSREAKQFFKTAGVDGFDWCDDCEDVVPYRETTHGIDESDYITARYCRRCGNVLREE